MCSQPNMCPKPGTLNTRYGDFHPPQICEGSSGRQPNFPKSLWGMALKVRRDWRSSQQFTDDRVSERENETYLATPAILWMPLVEKAAKEINVARINGFNILATMNVARKLYPHHSDFGTCYVWVPCACFGRSKCCTRSWFANHVHAVLRSVNMHYILKFKATHIA